MTTSLLLILCCVPHTLYGLRISNKDFGPVDEIAEEFSIYSACLPTDKNRPDISSDRKPKHELAYENPIALKPIKGPSNGKASDIVLYITTHLSNQHKSFLKCWPSKILAGSKMLAHTDVIVQTFTDVTPEVKSDLAAFPNEIVRLADLGQNVGYQEGAMKGVAEAFRSGWLTDYDWMIRVNPDVVIWSESPLMAVMRSSETWGIFANCNTDTNSIRIHTDMFAIRPKRVSSTAFSDWETAGNAELQATREFQFIIDGKHEYILVDKNRDTACRVRANGVWHENSYCEDVFQRKPWIENQFLAMNEPQFNEVQKCDK